MKRNLFIIASIFIGTIIILLAGNIITIGDKIYEMTKLKELEYAFYAVIVIAFLSIIIVPLVRLHKTPTFPRLSIDEYSGDDEQTRKKLRSFANKLQNNLYYLPAEERDDHKKKFAYELEHFYDTAELKEIVQKEIDARYKMIKSHIHEWSKTVFMITAVCQSGKIDALTSMVINFRMIGDLIRCSGFRPTNKQLFRQYGRILATSLFSYYIQGALTGMDDLTIALDSGGDAMADAVDANIDGVSEAGFLGSLHNLKIAGIIPASIIDGTLNTLLTLRIGYVTLEYLKKGSEALEGKKGIKVRRQAMLQSAKAMVEISKDSTIQGSKMISDKITELLSGKKAEKTAAQSE